MNRCFSTVDQMGADVLKADVLGVDIFIRPFEKRSYYVIPLGVRPSVCPSVCKLFLFRVTPPTVYVRLS